jgi:hypothetical protein
MNVERGWGRREEEWRGRRRQRGWCVWEEEQTGLPEAHPLFPLPHPLFLAPGRGEESGEGRAGG